MCVCYVRTFLQLYDIINGIGYRRVYKGDFDIASNLSHIQKGNSSE